MDDDKKTAADKKPQQHRLDGKVENQATALERARRGGEPIPVAELRFVATNGIEIPGPGSHRIGKIIAGVPAQSATGNGKYSVEYWPWVRHHCVTYTEDAKAATVFLVHETQVASWTPA